MPSTLQALPNTNGDTIKLPPGYPDEADSRGCARKSYKGELLDFGRWGTPESIEKYNASPLPQAHLDALAAMTPATTPLPLGYPKADARGDAMKTFKGKNHYFGKHGTQDSVDRFERSDVGKAFAAAAATAKQTDRKTWKDLDGTPLGGGCCHGARWTKHGQVSRGS